MKNKYTILITLLPVLLFAQKHDYQWFMGYQGGSQSSSTDTWGIMHFDFNTYNKPAFTQNFETEMNFYSTNTSICDSSGNLICYSNGLRLFDHQHNQIQNGNNLVGPDHFLGYALPQGALLLPTPGRNDSYTMFSIEEHPIEPMGWHFFYHTIERTANNDLKVIQKRKLIVQDSLGTGLISAVKHANGRDWWVLVPNFNSDVVQRVLLSPLGIQHDTIRTNFIINTSGLGQTVFSPDGTKYILCTDTSIVQPGHIYIHDFDRCTGRLSNGVTKEIDSPGANFGAGCAVSPDSRYLYAIHTAVIYQYDLWAPDILATETLVGEYDGFVSGWYGSYFMFGQTGADGRIYINSWTTTFHLHEINFPHRTGTDCSVRNHSIESPVYLIFGIPSFPNFRLGPVDGAACDSLGFDNHPLCNWRWETEDTLSPLTITFTDLSTYQPDTWHWDFGDGSTSTERYPQHTYDTAGIYNVCLVVSNAYSADTLCMVLPLGVVSSSDEAATFERHLRVGPNPFNEHISVALDALLPQSVFRLYDVSGQLVAEQEINYGIHHIRTGHLPQGFYSWQVMAGGQVVRNGKVVKNDD